MSKRESPIGIVIALLVTFGLGAGSIWWAYQFGFGTQSNSVQALPDYTSAQEAPVITQSPAPTLTPTPQPVKSDDAQKLPIQEQVEYITGTNQLTSSGQQALEKLANTAIKYTNQNVILRVHAGIGESEYSQTLAQQRGESIATYFRDKGFSGRIIISKSNLEDVQQRRKVVEVSLIKN